MLIKDRIECKGLLNIVRINYALIRNGRGLGPGLSIHGFTPALKSLLQTCISYTEREQKKEDFLACISQDGYDSLVRLWSQIQLH